MKGNGGDAPAKTAFRFADDFAVRLQHLRAEQRRDGRDGEGGRAGRTRGEVEFHDHRVYVPGDDVRAIDWNIVMRSDTLAVKRFTREESPETLVILDRSASMGPAGSSQDRQARELAAAVGWLALAAGGTASLLLARTSGAGLIAEQSGPRAGDAWLHAFRTLPDPEGADPFGAVTRLPFSGAPGRAVVLITDGLIEPPPARLFGMIGAATDRGVVLVVCAHADPLASASPHAGATLRDPETRATVSAASVDAWRIAHREERAAHIARMIELAARHGLTGIGVHADEPFERPVRAAHRGRGGRS